jgi:hypothetical protein
MDFSSIYEALSTLPGLTESIGVEEAVRFIRLAASLKREIAHYGRSMSSENQIPVCSRCC